MSMGRSNQPEKELRAEFPSEHSKDCPVQGTSRAARTGRAGWVLGGLGAQAMGWGVVLVSWAPLRGVSSVIGCD